MTQMGYNLFSFVTYITQTGSEVLLEDYSSVCALDQISEWEGFRMQKTGYWSASMTMYHARTDTINML